MMYILDSAMYWIDEISKAAPLDLRPYEALTIRTDFPSSSGPISGPAVV
jgi:hypothetical protein